MDQVIGYNNYVDPCKFSHDPDPLSILIQLKDDETLLSANLPSNMMYFTNEQFATRLRLLIPHIFKQFFHFTQILQVFLHLNVVRVLMGCSVLGILFQLDLFLLEFLFIYTVKMGQKEMFNLSTHIPYFQLVTGLLDSCKG